ncbi:MAG: hypothetical protein ABSD38_24455 [Syntrophorhabdales bacterium]|jgi:hypothetical protein
MKRIVLGLGIMVLALALFAQTASAAAAKESAPGETAVVRSGAYTELVSADGAKVSGLSVTLTPGEHTVVMKLAYPINNNEFMGGYFFYSLVNGSVTFNAEPGHQYVAYVTTAAGPTKEDEMGTGFTWVGNIEDKTAHQKVAKTETLPLEALPRTPGSGGGGSFMSHR